MHTIVLDETSNFPNFEKDLKVNQQNFHQEHFISINTKKSRGKRIIAIFTTSK